MHTEDVVAALLVVWGNHLRAGGTVPWARIEDALRVDLTASGRHAATMAIVGDDAVPVPPAAWTKAQAGDRERVLLLLDRRHLEAHGAGAAQAGGPGPFPVPERMRHAFAGSATTGLGVLRGGEVDAYHPAVRFPRRTTLRWADVEAFITSRSDAAALRERLLWEDANNLHLTDGGDWARFVEAVHAAEGAHDEVLVQTMGRVTGNVRFADGTDRAWVDLVTARKNPDFAPQFGFLSVGRRPAPMPAPGVGEQSLRLAEALMAAERVAGKVASDPWVAVFREAREILTPGRAFQHPLSSLFEGASLPDPALRLLVAAGIADVFGGMGSWNDVVADDVDKPVYEEVSERLFGELVPSLLSATEASRQDTP